MDHNALIDFRRELHRHAEPGFLEFGTAARIEGRLAGLPVTILTGSDVQDLSGVVGAPDPATREHWARLATDGGADPDRVDHYLEHGTALVAQIDGDRPGPTWALRTDIDALPIREADDDQHLPAREGFNSTTGAMHACGHDCHAAIGVGLLHRLSDHDFPGTVKIFFQPAEEGVRGAQTMIDAGVLDGVDRMLGVHVRGDSPVSTVIGSVVGGMATRKLAVSFQGRASHASGAPQEGRNALLAAAMASLGIMSLPRYAGTDTRLNVGTLHAGDNVNIVPALAELTCEARAADDEVIDDLTERVRAVIAGAAAAYGVDHDVQITGRAVTIAPDDVLVSKVLDAAATVDGVPEVLPTSPQAGSDDVNLMIKGVQQAGGQGAYLNIGADSPAPHHNPYFDPDERAIFTAIDLLEAIVRTG
ncbi:amidohydrolase [Microlunatus soli]|uniref:Aminobenzoyl-glutamate utilization protein A n=1 Tax=Microlunatus soli TaxID=630515 RepID=A0A1H1NZY4_9ACTN|nr:amidohydrolase [Microlunatus soli]SDS04517.1 aminobenzoyl-glutamate utilization protein A [Microlunatus soli]